MYGDMCMLITISPRKIVRHHMITLIIEYLKNDSMIIVCKDNWNEVQEDWSVVECFSQKTGGTVKAEKRLLKKWVGNDQSGQKLGDERKRSGRQNTFQ